MHLKLTKVIGAIVLSDILPIEIRGNYQSINNLAYGAGSAYDKILSQIGGMRALTSEDRLGAAVGGLLADSIGWRWEFGVCSRLINGVRSYAEVVLCFYRFKCLSVYFA